MTDNQTANLFAIWFDLDDLKDERCKQYFHLANSFCVLHLTVFMTSVTTNQSTINNDPCSAALPLGYGRSDPLSS